VIQNETFLWIVLILRIRSSHTGPNYVNVGDSNTATFGGGGGGGWHQNMFFVKVHFHYAKSTYPVKYLIFYEHAATNTIKHEGIMLG
jgi:hypothetical protein